MEKVRMAVIGLGQRGSGLTDTLLAIEEADITYVCDLYEDRIADEIARIEKARGVKPQGTTDYREVLASPEVDAVLVSTCWSEHVPVAVAAMKAGKAVALEVGGAYDINDCHRLVAAWEETRVPFMFMENCCFDRFEMLATSLVRNGVLGEIVHCHGAYSHDLRDEILGGNVNRHYRLENYRNRNCENYPTHELGPIAKLLDINRGNRMVSLSSFASKSVGLTEFSYSDKNPDPSLKGAKFRQGDVITTVITCAGGETITLTLNTTLPGYYSREFTVRGTKGTCNQEANIVILDDGSGHKYWEPHLTLGHFMNNADEYKQYLPAEWRDITDEQLKLGHGGMDYIEFRKFIDALLSGEEMPIDVYDAAAWMAVSALSEQSIALGGAPVAFPDFTGGAWVTRKPKDVTEYPVVKRD